MLTSVFFFAIMNALAKYFQNIPAHELIFFRSFFSIVFSVSYLRAHHINVWGNNKPWLIVRSLMGGIALFLFFLTLKHMPLASASTIQYLSPVFTVLLATQINKQVVRPIQWLYFAISFVGAAIIKGFDERVETTWLLVGIASAFFAGLAYNAIIKSKGTDHPMVIVFYVPLVAFPATGIACLYEWVWPAGIEWLLLLAMAICAQAGQYFTTLALHSDKASRIAPLNYLGAVFAITFGYFIFDETVNVMAIGGMLLVVLGVILNSRVR
jgi:drug/metabolite transporter (DMT)-like permease